MHSAHSHTLRFFAFELTYFLRSRQALADSAAAAISAADVPHLSIIHPPQLSIFTFKLSPPGVSGEDLDMLNLKFLAAVHDKGRCLLSPFRSIGGVPGELCIRVCVLSCKTGEEAVEHAVEDILEAARELTAGL